MAELGSIQYEDSRQHTSARDQVDQRDILQGIKDVGDVAIEAKKQDILGDLRTSLDETTKEAASLQQAPVKDVAVVKTGDPEVDAKMAHIATLQAKANSSSGTTQRRIEMELRQKTEDFRNKYPGMQGDIDTEFSSFKSTDADYASLALSDLENTGFSAQAAKQLERITEKAYGHGAGELGMDPMSFRFGTREFMQEYIMLENVQHTMEANVRIAQSIHAQGGADAAEDLPNKFQPLIAGASSALNLALVETSRQWQEVAEARRFPHKAGNPEIIQYWDLEGKKRALLEMNKIEQGLMTEVMTVPPALQDTPEYRAIESNVEGILAQTAKFKEGIFSGDPTIMAVYDGMKTARNFNWEAGNPVMTKINTAMENSASSLDWAVKAELGATAQIQASKVAGTITNAFSMPEIFGYAISASGHMTAPPGSSAETIQEHRQQFVAYNPYRNGSDVSPEGTRRAGVGRTEKIVGLEATEMIKNGVHPDTASHLLGAVAADTESTYSSGTMEPEAWERQIASLANPNVLLLNGVALNSQWDQQGKDLGNVADIMWIKGEDARVGGDIALAGSDVGNILNFSDIATVDKSRLKSDGIITFEIDELRIKEVVNADPTETGGYLGITGSATVAQKAINEAIRTASKLSERLSRQIQAKANIMALKQSTDVAKFEAAYATMQYGKLLERPKVVEEGK